jgi:hypothetical protein
MVFTTWVPFPSQSYRFAQPGMTIEFSAAEAILAFTGKPD